MRSEPRFRTPLLLAVLLAAALQSAAHAAPVPGRAGWSPEPWWDWVRQVTVKVWGSGPEQQGGQRKQGSGADPNGFAAPNAGAPGPLNEGGTGADPNGSW